MFVCDENCEEELNSFVKKIEEFAGFHENVTFFIVDSTSEACGSLKLVQTRTKLTKVFFFNRSKDFSSMGFDIDNFEKVSTELDTAK